MNHAEILTCDNITAALDECDYFELLNVSPSVTTEELKRRFYELAERVHPDNFPQGDCLRQKATVVYQRISEAYKTLIHPERRARYVELLRSDRAKHLRYSVQAEEDAKRAVRKSEEEPGKTLQGNKFFKLAMAALREGKHQGALLNIRMAQKAEPQNTRFTEWEAKIRNLHKS